MEYFGKAETIEQLKAEYLKYLNKFKGSSMMEEIRKQYEDLLFSFGETLNEKIDEENKELPEDRQKEHFDAKSDRFADTLEKIIGFNMNIEIIGQWIWCFDSYEYRDQLRDLGFWYSASKKAWVYSGKPKRMIRSRNTINAIRKKWGSEIVKEQEKD